MDENVYLFYIWMKWRMGKLLLHRFSRNEGTNTDDKLMNKVAHDTQKRYVEHRRRILEF